MDDSLTIKGSERDVKLSEQEIQLQNRIKQLQEQIELSKSAKRVTESDFDS